MIMNHFALINQCKSLQKKGHLWTWVMAHSNMLKSEILLHRCVVTREFDIVIQDALN